MWLQTTIGPFGIAQFPGNAKQGMSAVVNENHRLAQ